MEDMPLSRWAAPAAAALAALSVAAGLAGCSSAASAPAPPAGAGGTGVTVTGGDGAGTAGIVPHASRLRWHACGGQLAGLECTTLQVPLNYADPGGRKLTLALSMAPATGAGRQQQGVPLGQPGGPGRPGPSAGGEGAAGIRREAAADYDIVG